ncbi:hypothetical protein J5X98_24505 [Leptothermofonsia sichuanensis E412]|uniref:hypothetical protein n=1 Tax=Leptothermofonsia sichuanensis TaxID=2917832 RepID=UPI001CA67E0C|nr:hypothetical protein [Leptothermofonsia sichuanensis]QZZ20378.1 hypothetical protein J5X98_24505 [Leptothermofonsia sichuanensis E412]
MPRAIVQGETLRVRHDTGQHWDLEQIARNRLISVWLIPTLLMAGLSWLLRSLSRSTGAG